MSLSLHNEVWYAIKQRNHTKPNTTVPNNFPYKEESQQFSFEYFFLIARCQITRVEMNTWKVSQV